MHKIDNGDTVYICETNELVELKSDNSKRCIISGLPADIHHVKTVGSAGGRKHKIMDHVDNMMPLSRKFHVMIDQKGAIYMANKHWQVKQWLDEHGWIFETKEENGFKDRWVNYEIWELL